MLNYILSCIVKNGVTFFPTILQERNQIRIFVGQSNEEEEEEGGQGWKFMSCSHCQELGQQAWAGSWLAEQEWTTNQ